MIGLPSPKRSRAGHPASPKWRFGSAQAGRGRFAFGVLAFGYAFLYLPIALVMIYSFNESRIGSVWTGFSLRWYRELFTEGELWSGLRTSIVVGLLASTCSVTLGALAAIGLKRWPVRAQRAASGVLALPLVVPDMIIAVSLALFFHALSADQGLITVVLAHTAFGLAYAFVAMWGAVHDFDETLVDAAVDCGATPWQAFWRVTVPVCLPSILDIGRYYFVNAMTTISAVVFLYSPKTTLASISILHLDEAGAIGSAAAMATLIVLTSAVVTAVMFAVEWFLIRRTQAWRNTARQ